MRRREVLSGIISIALTSNIAMAKAAYKSKSGMIKSAKVIAIVEIVNIEEIQVKGKYWTYSQKAFAKVESVLKGELGKEAYFYGGYGFICAQSRYEIGRYLVFLHYDKNFLVTNNWHLSTRKISNDTVDWFEDEFLQKKDFLLSNVISEIQQISLEAKTK